MLQQLVQTAPTLERERARRPAEPVVFGLHRGGVAGRRLEALAESQGWRCELLDDAEALLSSLPEAAPHCLVADINPPGLSGLELQLRLAACSPDTRVIFITTRGALPTTAEAIEAGAPELITEPVDDTDMLCALTRALAHSAADRRRRAELQALRERRASLTGREREIMDLVVTGRPNKQVGFLLGITLITVKVHRGRVMRKMKAQSLPDLVKFSLQLASAQGSFEHAPQLWRRSHAGVADAIS